MTCAVGFDRWWQPVVANSQPSGRAMSISTRSIRKGPQTSVCATACAFRWAPATTNRFGCVRACGRWSLRKQSTDRGDACERAHQSCAQKDRQTDRRVQNVANLRLRSILTTFSVSFSFDLPLIRLRPAAAAQNKKKSKPQAKLN